MKCEVRRLKGPPSLRSGEGGARNTPHATRNSPAFTLIELLVVIAIMGILAAIAMPAINKLKPNVMAAATQKLLTDVGRARQLAIAQHTTVYMVFVHPGYWTDPAYSALSALPPGSKDRLAAEKLVEKQMVGYNFVSLRSIGDQPGRNTVRYLDTWRTLPEGAFIPWQKFFGPAFTVSNIVNGSAVGLSVTPFYATNTIPFPLETAPPNPANGTWIKLPYIAFNYLGQLVDANGLPTQQNVLIPLSQGTVNIARNSSKAPAVPPLPAPQPNFARENPVGNTTNTFNIINIDWLTGRARVERQEVL